MRQSVWHDRPTRVTSDPLPEDGRVDDLVVGAGLTGLTTALLLARAGRRVLVVEARHPGAVTTGHTTAKLSLLQGTKLSRMLRHHSRRLAAAYVEANLEGQTWLLRFCEDHGVSFQRRRAVTYAATARELPAARDELAAALRLGLPARWVDRFDRLPVPHAGGVVLEDQAQFDPMDVVEVLAAQVRAHGGAIHLGRRVVGVSLDGGRAELDDGTTLASATVVLGTGAATLDRGLYFAKVEAGRSYVLVFEGAEPPDAMYLSAGSPTRSLRDIPGRRLLMVGGAGHVVGRVDSERAHLDELRSWTAAPYPGAVETHAWSAQDYSAPDGVPFVGPLPRGCGRIYVATGYDKWGMTNAVAAARSISTEILDGSPPSWAGPLRHRVTGPRTAVGMLRLNAEVGLAACRTLPGVRSRPRCSHLGGVLTWNDAEETWDCPLHGSRFEADGSVLEGPATRPISVKKVATEERVD
jgi:glycine/D-amino acid oxidase-like deaminating enzyme